MTNAQALIVGAGEAPYTRHPLAEQTTEQLLAEALRKALADAGIPWEDVDGLAVSSFTLAPDRVADLAWRLGLKLRWLMEDTNGGASGINMLQHAVRALEAGDARTIVVLSGDCFHAGQFRQLVDNYNRATSEYLAPIVSGAPNALFAMLTQRHMRAHGLTREDYAHLVLSQRSWAGLNPGAVYRAPLSLDEYLAAPVVAEPLHRYDCPPVVSGANAVVLTSTRSSGVAVRSVRGLHNHDGQDSDGLQTGIATIADQLWGEAGFGPGDLDAIYVYDDYPAVAVMQLSDLGVIQKGDEAHYLRHDIGNRSRPVNTSGGLLSAGQAGAAGGLHGLGEAVTQLLGRAGERQVPDARRAVVTGYGMVVYRYGSCANAAVLEAT